jgi:integrase
MTFLDLTMPHNQLLKERLSPFIEAAQSPATRRAYSHDLASFRDFGGTIPATPQIVADWLVQLSTRYRVATISRRLAALSRAHSLLNLPNPVPSELVQLTLKGVRRKLGVAQRQAKPLMRDDMIALLTVMGNSPRDVRDRALLLVGFCGAFRRSELVALQVADLRFVPEGVLIHIRKSKTDQEGQGRTIGIPKAREASRCAVQALAHLLNQLGNPIDGPIFRPMTKGGASACTPLSDRAVSNIIKERALAAGMKADDLSGHSLRAGLCTSAAEAGIPSHKIRETSGHKSDAMLARYIRDGNIWKDNAGGLF